MKKIRIIYKTAPKCLKTIAEAETFREALMRMYYSQEQESDRLIEAFEKSSFFDKTLLDENGYFLNDEALNKQEENKHDFMQSLSDNDLFDLLRDGSYHFVEGLEEQKQEEEMKDLLNRVKKLYDKTNSQFYSFTDYEEELFKQIATIIDDMKEWF